MLGSDVMRGYNDMLVLCLLMERDSYGYEISKEVEKRSEGQYIMKETTLYSAFGRLEKLGYVSAYKGAETQGRPRVYYSITKKGETAFLDKCAEWRILKKVVNQFTREENINGNNS